MNIRVFKEIEVLGKLSEFAKELPKNSKTNDEFIEYASDISSEIVDLFEPTYLTQELFRVLDNEIHILECGNDMGQANSLINYLKRLKERYKCQ